MAFTMKCSGTEHVWDHNSIAARPTPRPNAYRQDDEIRRYRPVSIPYNLQESHPYNNFPAFRDIEGPPPPVQLFNNQFAYPRDDDSIPLNLQNSEPPLPLRFWKAVPLQTPPTTTYPAPPQQRPSSPRPTLPSPQSQLKSQQDEPESPLGKWFNLQQKKYSSPTSGGPAWAWGYERYAQPGGVSDMDKFYSYRVEQNDQGDNPDLNRGVYDVYKVHYDTRYGLPPRSRGLSNRNPKSKVDEPPLMTTLDDLHDNHFRQFKDDHFFQIQTTPKSTLRFIHSVPPTPPLLVSTRRTVKDVTLPKSVDNKARDSGDDGHPNYKIIILSNTTVSPPIRIMVKGKDGVRFPDATLPPPGWNFTFHNPPQLLWPVVSTRKPPPLTKIIVTEGPTSYAQQRRIKYDQDNFPTTTPPLSDRHPSTSPRSFRFRSKNDKTLHQFSWHTSTAPQNENVIIIPGSATPRYHLSPSNKNYTFPPWPARPRNQRPVLISTTMQPRASSEEEPLPPISTRRPNKILRRVKVRKRPTTTTTTTTTEFSTTDYYS